MNKKQLICMWLGITTFSVAGFILIIEYDDWNPLDLIVPFLVFTLITTVITSGLIITFKDKKKDNDESQ